MSQNSPFQQTYLSFDSIMISFVHESHGNRCLCEESAHDDFSAEMRQLELFLGVFQL